MKNVKVFSNKTELTLDAKCFSTFIQTDKPNYCPGQAVRIRVVSLGPDGKPNHSPVNITIRVSQKPKSSVGVRQEGLISDGCLRIREETCSDSGWLWTASTESCPKSFSCLKTLLWVSGASSPAST